MIFKSISTDVSEEYDVNHAELLVDNTSSLHRGSPKHDLNFGYERHGDRNGGTYVSYKLIITYYRITNYLWYRIGEPLPRASIFLSRGVRSSARH